MRGRVPLRVRAARVVSSGLGMLQSGLAFLQRAVGIKPSPAAAITALKLALQARARRPSRLAPLGVRRGRRAPTPRADAPPLLRCAWRRSSLSIC